MSLAALLPRPVASSACLRRCIRPRDSAIRPIAVSFHTTKLTLIAFSPRTHTTSKTRPSRVLTELGRDVLYSTTV